MNHGLIPRIRDAQRKTRGCGESSFRNGSDSWLRIRRLPKTRTARTIHAQHLTAVDGVMLLLCLDQVPNHGIGTATPLDPCLSRASLVFKELGDAQLPQSSLSELFRPLQSSEGAGQLSANTPLLHISAQQPELLHVRALQEPSRQNAERTLKFCRCAMEASKR